ncbi:hypothetical protein FHS89_002292 [Rubricella aquisinus]|uniref:Sulfotransferase family protein n=1 Tax=Rubricella aquisinus TaxID=2028108 RepID=A0A840X358_9RHOB|nr:hypothetical protein [Rubricella aquisinus]MBB5516266.1 hypothetical protein [Rubricella aquisinus]
MGRLVLHIGMHKTGSSAVQHALVRNRHLLRWAGVHYPLSKGATGRRLSKQSDLGAAIAHEKDHGGPHPVFGPARERIARLYDVAGAARCTIVSAENLSGEHPCYAEAFRPFAGRVETEVIVVLRDHADWAVSFYAQMVRNRDVREPRSFAEWCEDEWTQAHLDYPTILGWWADVFGRQALRVIRYNGGVSVVPEVLAAAQLPAWMRVLPQVRRVRNPSPDLAALDPLRQRNAAEAGVPFTPNPPQCFSDEAERAAFRARYAPQWAQLSDLGLGPQRFSW